ncbi:flagellar hook-associated protein FlgL [bacterium]|nr:flagellar hook-associated protein FlgL [bacterium]
MSISRVSTAQLNKAFSSQLSNTQSKFNKLAEQIGTGVSVSSMSDDPVAAGSIIKVNKQMGDIETYLANLESADVELSQVDSTLKSVNDQLSKAHDLAMQISNGTMGSDELQAYQSELDSIIDNVIKFANTQYNDKYLFSGTRTTTIPYSQSTDGLTYRGNDESRSVLIGDNKTKEISYTGKNIFGEASFTTDEEGKITVDTSASSGALGALYQLKAAIQDPENIDTAAVSSAMGGLSSSMDTVTATKTRAGAISSSFEDLKSTYQSDSLRLEELRSNLQDTDLPSAISNWYSVYQAMQASYSMLSQTMGVSLLNFI